MLRKLVTLATLFTLITAISVMNGFADESTSVDTTKNENSLNDLSWLAGHWRANAFGGICDEIWTPPSGGSMVGTFKLVVDGKIGFYEFMTITIENSGPTMRLKHFNSDLTGWEEKDKVITFPFVNMFDNELRLDGIFYRSSSPDSLRIELNIQKSDGKVNHQIINFWRVEKP